MSFPRLLNLVPTPPPGILGREGEVKTAREHLLAGLPAVLVNGVGGIGKTTVALKYLAEHGHEYRHIAWLTVSSTLPEAIIADRVLLQSLGLEPTIAALPPEQLFETGCKMVLHHLSELAPCLLILDNYNDLADLLARKAALGACRAHVLLTSRTEPQGWTCVPVESLPVEQARELFRRFYLFEKPSDAGIDALLNELGRHTLLTELSAKVAQTRRMPFAELSRHLREGFIHHAALNTARVDTGQSGLSVETRRKIDKVETYIGLIFSEIEELFDFETAHLKIFTLLPPAEIHAEETLSNIYQLAEKNIPFKPETLELLVEKGWLQRQDDPTQALAYQIHPLVQDVAVRRLGVTAEWAGEVIQFVAEFIHYNQVDTTHNLFEKVNGRPWAEYLEKRFRNEETEQISYLLDRLAYLEENFGNYMSACDLGERALAIDLKNFGPEHPTVATRQSNLALVCQHLGQYGRARDLLETALAAALKNFGPDHPDVALRQSNLATVCRNQGQYGRARDLLEDALAAAVKNFGPEHPNVAVRQSNLALVYDSLGQFDRARDLLEDALAADLKNFGPDHPNVAVRQSNLATVYDSLGQFDRARDLLEGALVIDLKNFGPDHPNVALHQSNLANIYRNLGQYDRARDLLEAALAAHLKNFGPDHPNVALHQSNLANVLQNLGQYDRARELHEAALAAHLKNFGPDHPNVAFHQVNLGAVFFHTGEKEKAKECFISAYRLFQKLLGEEHPETRNAKEWLDSVS